MIFGNKDKKKCEGCGSKANKSYSFCPHCGNNFLDSKKDQRDFGMLGRNDFSEQPGNEIAAPFGITDKLFNSVFNSLMKNLDKQMRDQMKDMDRGFGDAEVKSFPNGIRIKVSGPQGMNAPNKVNKINTSVNRTVGESQIRKMNSLPRAKAKSNVKRIGDRVVYELSTPGVLSPEDVFVSKLESGYEIKVIGDKKVYVNSVPITLPLKKYTISKNKLLIEFNAGHQVL